MINLLTILLTICLIWLWYLIIKSDTVFYNRVLITVIFVYSYLLFLFFFWLANE